MCRHKADSYQDRNHREVQGLMRSSGLPEEVCYTLPYPDREEHTVDIVKQYLRTSEQKAWLDAHDLSIEDLLNGRYGGHGEARAQPILEGLDPKTAAKKFSR